VGRFVSLQDLGIVLIRSLACDLAMTRSCMKRNYKFSGTVFCPCNIINDPSRTPLALSPFAHSQPGPGPPLEVAGVDRVQPFLWGKRPSRCPRSSSANTLVYDAKPMSLVSQYAGFTRFLTYFCYNFHFVPVIENHPISAHVTTPAIKILKVASARPRHPQSLYRGTGVFSVFECAT